MKLLGVGAVEGIGFANFSAGGFGWARYMRKSVDGMGQIVKDYHPRVILLREVNKIVVLITEIRVVSIGVITIGIVVTGTIIIRAIVAWPITEDFGGDSGGTTWSRGKRSLIGEASELGDRVWGAPITSKL